MKTKRIISALLCAIMLIATFSGCEPLDLSIDPSDKNTETAHVEGIDAIGYTIPYLRTDSLNPYECKSEVNKSISMLLFDPLFNVNNDFSTTAVIAESSSFTNKNKLSVKIKSGLTFTDGSARTVQDVV